VLEFTADHPDPDQRARAAADLTWWVQAGRSAIADLADTPPFARK